LYTSVCHLHVTLCAVHPAGAFLLYVREWVVPWSSGNVFVPPAWIWFPDKTSPVTYVIPIFDLNRTRPAIPATTLTIISASHRSNPPSPFRLCRSILHVLFIIVVFRYLVLQISLAGLFFPFIVLCVPHWDTLQTIRVNAYCQPSDVY